MFVCVYVFSLCVCVYALCVSVCMLPHVCVHVLACVPVEARVVGAFGAGIIGNCDLLGMSV